ncbi:4a-hydroxytetrahydrobiopterin dehydratase [Flagellimonas lutaonensis]|uniref:Putative pterin-4-alpha-carbinolamine dehydratase n=1 Tax=Flagellimonas lutaonensis TaxID=516051 RepID=A0A0D5YVW6_9FLAO|nr:4a-hydroxytetrahydrobiopterin dehydratase [Allomuricauda lutaonensis]AKA36036.1 pterin-4-alpha-carbinolamine dehydratase [Allomuricauda lutaonensis]
MEKLTDSQIEEKLASLEGWAYGDGYIQKSYQFKDFKEAFSIMVRIAFECEAMNHHPDWSNVYNSLTIQLNTHDANGVTGKDFELAHAIEDIVNA